MSQRNSHAHYRELISARLDGALSPARAAELAGHLLACGRCRATEAAYRAQRQQLRALVDRQPLPPRDMWARTSAALDREIARGGSSAARPRRQALLGSAAIASVAVLGLSINLITAQLPPTADPTGAPPATLRAVLPTPFTIPPEALAFVGTGSEGLAVYRTRVDRVCPAAAIDCVDYRATAPALVRLPRTLQPSNLALSPNGGRLAIQGREPGGEDVIAVVVMPEDELARQPNRVPGTGQRSPAAPTPSIAAEASASPSPTAGGIGSTASPSVTPLMAGPSASGIAPAEPPWEVLATPTVLPSLPAAAMVSVMEDVRAVGAPAAWSADGAALAFSAMPADLQRGPDVYVWRPGDERAVPLTDDHASYFASWAGDRVVVSRVADQPAREGGVPRIETVVVDVATGEERASDGGEDLWLPAVDPLGSKLIAWQGRLSWHLNEVQPQAGSLYVADWVELDPFAAAALAPDGMNEPVGGDEFDEAPPEAGEEASSAADDGVEATEEPSDGTADEADAAEAPPTPVQALRDRAAPGAHSAAVKREAESGPAGEPGLATAALTLIPVEDDRDPETEPVRDWQVRWSADGQVLAYWVADVPGSSWGQLAVVPVDLATGTLLSGEPLLEPSLARRAFTLGSNRVAWVAPAEGEPQGELRIRTWGPDGFGGLRLRPQPLREVVPAS